MNNEPYHYFGLSAKMEDRSSQFTTKNALTRAHRPLLPLGLAISNVRIQVHVQCEAIFLNYHAIWLHS